MRQFLCPCYVRCFNSRSLSRMKKVSFFYCLLFLALGLSGSCTSGSPSQPNAASEDAPGAPENQGFTSLFDGQTFAGWQGAVDQYAIRDGCMVSMAGGHIFTTREYSDFILRMEFKLPPGGNNGLAIRYSGKGDPAYEGMCELQILDNSAPQYADLDPRQYHGSIYGKVAAQRGHLRPAGEWNYQEVTVIGSRIRVTLNGTVILDADQAEVTDFMNEKLNNNIPESGYLGFAGHGKDVAFRNLTIKNLAPDSTD